MYYGGVGDAGDPNCTGISCGSVMSKCMVLFWNLGAPIIGT